MKKLLLLLFGLWACMYGSLAAQVLTGVVYDELTRQPVYNTNVYLEGTSYFTITDSAGRFVLPVRRLVNTRLIISHLAYEEVVYANPFRGIPSLIFLKEKVESLSEVTITGSIVERYSRQRKLAAFRRHFLGNTTAGRACRIINENDIQLIYDSGEKKLTASCDKPLRIENRYLGYEVQFTLNNFEVIYSNNSLTDNSVIYSIYTGTSVFKDISPHNERIGRRREDTYRKSTANFFRHVLERELQKTDWLLMKNGNRIPPEQCFAVADTFSMKKISLLPDIKGYADGRGYIQPVYGEIEVHSAKSMNYDMSDMSQFQNHREVSILAFLSGELYADSYGNISPVDKVVFMGAMGEQRLGDTLPMDFEPERKL